MTVNTRPDGATISLISTNSDEISNNTASKPDNTLLLVTASSISAALLITAVTTLIIIICCITVQKKRRNGCKIHELQRIGNLYDNDCSNGDMIHECDHINQNHLYSQHNDPNMEDESTVVVVTHSDNSFQERMDSTFVAITNHNLHNSHLLLDSHTNAASEQVNENSKVEVEFRTPKENSLIENKGSECDTTTTFLQNENRHIKGENNGMPTDTQSSSTQLLSSTTWYDNARYESFDSKYSFSQNDLADEVIYAPIYDVPLQLSPEINIPSFDTKDLKVIKTLGMGYFGKVLLAEQVQTTIPNHKFEKEITMKLVAIKKLKEDCTPSVKYSFHKELKFMSRLRHENIVQVIGACLTKEPFIVMEYVVNGDLENFIQKFDDIYSGNEGSSSPLQIHVSTLIHMCTQIASGMNYLSSHNYIHCDLAARNILVGENNHVKISDFGMSRNLYTSHYYIMEGKAAVPVRWMAKECFSNKYSTKSDVWSFGVTMWEVFTLGQCIPYEDMTDMQVVEDAAMEKRTLLNNPDKCRLDVYRVMLDCWEAVPNRRASFNTLQSMLQSLISS